MPGVNPDSDTLNACIDDARANLELPSNIRQLLRWCGLELRRLAKRVESLEGGLGDEIERLTAILEGRPVEAEDEDPEGLDADGQA